MDDDLFDELILRWDEFREQGRKLTPDALMAIAQESGLLPKRMSPAEREALLEKLTQEIGIHANFPRPPGPVTPIRISTEYDTVTFYDRGGLGVVSLAKDPTLKREIAIKCIGSNLVNDPVSRERFYREALITAQLEHPGVVPIYGLGHDKAGNPCYAMKFIEGQTLGAAIQELHLDRKSSRNKAERVRRFRRLITQFVSVCRTVAFAHSRQIIHRDLKPANIMLGEYGETIIFDWGLAKSLSKSGASSEPAGSEQDDKLPHLSSPVQECLTDDMVGSPGYTSPEQNRNDPDIGPTTDIFALGATLYAILTGRSPKAMSSSPAFLQEFCWDETTSPREVNHDVPRPLDAICCKAMAFAPADRYSTAETLAADVEAWLSDSPVSAHEDRWYERAARLARHNFAWIVSGVVAMVVATAVSTFFFLEERKARTDEAAALEKAKIAHRAALDTAEELRKTYEKEQTARQDAERSKQKANDLTTAVSQQNEQLKRDLAMICIERGAIECSAGRPDRGAAFFAKAYQDLPVADKTLRASAFRLFTVWAANLGEPLLYNGQRSIALFSPEGAKVLMAVDNLLYLWDATTGKPIAKPLCHESRVTAVCFSLDGKSLITGSQDGSVQLWNVATAKPIHVYPRHAIRITAVCYSSDGKTAATGDAFGGVNVLDIVAGRSIGQPLADESAIAAVSLSPDGKRALTQNSNGTSRLWEVATGTPIGEPSGHYFVQKNRSWWGPAVTGGWVLAMTQYKMITGRHDNVARLWRIGDVSPPQLIGEPLRHEAEVTVAAFGPDGKTILTGSRDKTARLWDAATGKPVGEPLRHDGNVEFVCFGPDGKQILTVSGDKMARLWDATTGKPTSEPLRHDGDVLIICFSPDGKTVLTGSKDKTARLWNAATGAPLGEPLRHDDGVRTVAFSPDGKTVLTGSDDKTARVWDAVTTKPIGEPLLHTGGVLAVSFGLDGRTLRTEDFTGTHVWEAASHHRELVLRDFERSTAQISPDGLTVLTVGKSGRLGLWDTVTGKPIGELDDFTGPACFSPSGRILLMASKDGTVRFWDAQSRAPTGGALPQEDKVQSVCFSPDGLTVATASGKNACLWNATTAKPIRQPLRHEDNVANVTFSADGRMLLTHTVSPKRSPHLWDVATGELLWKPTDSATVQCVSPDGRRVLATSREGLNSLRPTTGCALWTGESSIQVHQEIYAMAYSPDCRKLATVQQSRGVHLRDAKTGKPIGEPILHSGIKVACFSPDGLTLGTASRDGTTRLWNAATGKPTTSPLKHTDEVCCISFSADSQKIITGSDDKTARVWNASTGAPITESLRHHGKVVAVCFSPDGKAVLTGSEDRTARIWDAATGASTGEPLQHDNVVRAVTFRPDGKMVVTGSTGGTVHLWDACTAKPIGNPLHHTDAVVAVRFSPDEKTLLAVSVSDNTRLWDVITGKALGESLQHDCKVESVCFSSNNETLLTWS